MEEDGEIFILVEKKVPHAPEEEGGYPSSLQSFAQETEKHKKEGGGGSSHPGKIIAP